MKNEEFEAQLSFNDKDILLSDEEITKEKSIMISNITNAKENNYKMPKDLYHKLMSSDMHPNVYAILINGARQFNLSYDRFYKDDINVSRLNTIDVYKKILYSNSVLFIATTLTTLKLEADDCVEAYKNEAIYVYENCLFLTINYLKNNKKLIPPFLMFSDIDWNENIDFLLKCIYELDLDDKFLWKNIIRNKILNQNNMNKVIKDNTILKVMYLLLCDIKFDLNHKRKVRNFLLLEKVQEQIKEFDVYFYRKKVVPIIMGHELNIPLKEDIIYNLYKNEINNILTDYNFSNEGIENAQISLFEDDINKSLV